MADLALGLDIGTGGAKAIVADPTGSVQGAASASYELSASEPGQAEQRPEDWWAASVSAISSALQGVDASDVKAIGVTGQMHGSVLVDADLAPLRPASLWCDSRAAEAAESGIQEMGRARVIAETGNLPRPGFTGPQLRWLKDVGDPALDQAQWVLCAKDFVRAQLSGVAATDHSDASGTGLYSVNDEGWSTELASLWHTDIGLLPVILESAEVAGSVTSEAASATGLKAGTPVVAGAADNAASAVGAGIVGEGQLMMSIGTSGTLLAPRSDPEADLTGRCHLFRHAMPGRYYSMAVVLSAGGALAWWQPITGTSMDELSEEALAVAPGSEGLTMLPYLSGQRMPQDRPDARAGFIGLSLAHGRPHMARAAVEGACFAMADGLDCLEAVEVEAEQITLTGGASNHELWLETLSLVFPGLGFSRTNSGEGAAFGAALLAFQGAGADLETLLFDAVQTESIDLPEPEPRDLEALDRGRRRFQALSEDPVIIPASQHRVYS